MIEKNTLKNSLEFKFLLVSRLFPSERMTNFKVKIFYQRF